MSVLFYDSVVDLVGKKYESDDIQIMPTKRMTEQDYEDCFEPTLDMKQDILYVHYSGKLSGSNDYLTLAVNDMREKYPKQKILTVDTLSVSMGSGMLIAEAIKMHNKNVPDEEIVKYIKDNRQNFALYFAVTDLNVLREKGHLSKQSAQFGSMMNVNPILKINDSGDIELVHKVIGRKKAINFLFDKMLEIGQNLADFTVYILIGDNKEDGNVLKEKIKAYSADISVKIQKISTKSIEHAGKNPIAIAFHAKER